MDMQNSGGKTCGCPHHKVIPVLIILFGLLFLLGNTNVISTSMVTTWWPVLVIAGGFMKLMKNKCKCC